MAWPMANSHDQYIKSLIRAHDALTEAYGYACLGKIGQRNLLKAIAALRPHIRWAKSMTATTVAGRFPKQPPSVSLKSLAANFDKTPVSTPDPNSVEMQTKTAHLSRAGKVSSPSKTKAARENGRLGGLSRSRAKKAAARRNGRKPKRLS